MVISLFQQSGGGGSSGDKIGIAPPIISSTGLTYDGTAKSPVIGPYNEDAVAISYTPQVNAGTYSCTIALRDKSKYVWLDTYDTDNKTANWTVAKASGSSSLSKYAVELEEGGSDNVTVTRAGDGEIIATSSDTAVATVSVSGTIVTIFDGGTEGTATVSISVAAGTNYNAVGAKSVTVEVSHGPAIVTWSGGTDAEIVAMCEASDAGTLNLWDYWNVGDERTVSLSAMEATYVGESHRAQNVVMVIVNKGGYISNGKTTSFIVQQKNCLASSDSGTTSDLELGYMNSSATNSGSWKFCKRRSWCNNVYKNAVPSTLIDIFKQVKVNTATNFDSMTITETSDYFFLPAEAEIFKGDSTYGMGGLTPGQTTTAYSNTIEFKTLSRWKYYETASNCIKKIGSSGSVYHWWTRSPTTSNTFGDVDENGVPHTRTAKDTYGLAPAGCIGTINDGTRVIPSWQGGDIQNIIAKADRGEINLADYWNIGDRRKVSLSAMSATGVGESHRAQDVYFVLVDANNSNYEYVTPTSGRTYCNFVVQQENCLSSTDSGSTKDSEKGYLHNDYNKYTWNSCKRRTWCNNVYYNSLPSYIQNVLKQVKVKTATSYNTSTITETSDYTFLPAAKEVVGSSTSAANQTENDALSQFTYYAITRSNRLKQMGISGDAVIWWMRSPSTGSSINNANACLMTASGTLNTNSYTFVNGVNGLAPCFCI